MNGTLAPAFSSVGPDKTVIDPVEEHARTVGAYNRAKHNLAAAEDALKSAQRCLDQAKEKRDFAARELESTKSKVKASARGL